MSRWISIRAKNFFIIVLLIVCTSACSFHPKSQSETINIPNQVSMGEGLEHLENTAPADCLTDSIPFVPSEDQVISLRKQVEAGMSDEEIENLMNFFISANQRFNGALGERDFFIDLLNPYDLKWAYFNQTGEIQIGYAGNDNSGKVITYNEHDATWFISQLEDLKGTVRSSMLDRDFDRMIDLCTTAMEKHRAEAVKELFYMIHDMDFYLLRYGPKNALGARDQAILSTYYNSLAVWNEQQDSDTVHTVEGNLKTYHQLSDGTWECDGYIYQQRLEITGHMKSARTDTTFVYLTNIPISFDQAWKAAGFSSKTSDYFETSDAILVEWIEGETA